MNYNIRQYSSTLDITRGLTIALLGSAFIYLNHYAFSFLLVNTLLGLATLFLLLSSQKRVWFWFGFFMAGFWFWWINLSLQHYGYAWGLPLGIAIISLAYALLFLFFAHSIDKIAHYFSRHHDLIALSLKGLVLLGLSYIHPMGFDWYKPELMFVESYLGIQKWQFFFVLLGMVLAIYQKHWAYLLLIALAYQPSQITVTHDDENISLTTLHTTVEDKWNTDLHPRAFQILLQHIDKAIEAHKQMIVLPESVFPIFLNYSDALLEELQERAKQITIVTGGLYLDGRTPRNSTYIFSKNHMQVAHKVVLVPFGESNPLPDFLSKWVNETFYDSSVDYIASDSFTDYRVNGIRYRNAICFEATSERLYEGNPTHMIVLSNNGWFYPSIEPTLQKLLLMYYSRKYHTTIYHATNMSPSYIIKKGH